MSSLTFFVNGKKIVEKDPDPEWTLLFYLRKKLSLCGTKLGCAEGGCGACTVMVSKYDHAENKIIHLAVNACLAPICSMHGLAVTTVEGIGSTRTRLHPVQERIAKTHGSQCGFCTPGIVMSMYTLLRSMPKPSYHDLEVTLQGNLCRCTGYRPIIEGFRTFTEEWENSRAIQASMVNGTNGCAMGDKCCKNNSNGSACSDIPENTFDVSTFKPYDPSQEPIFPPELSLSTQYNDESLKFVGANVTWFRPTSLKELLQIKQQYNNAKIVTGNTEIGVEVKFKNFKYPIIVMPNRVKELNDISMNERGVTIGAAVTLTDMETFMNDLIKSMPPFKTKIFKSIVDMLHWFAGKQIRNIAAVGGNIMTGSPISDLNPIFMAANAELHLQSLNSSRNVKMDGAFFTGYRKNIVSADEILVSISIPFTSENQFFKSYKQAKRREDDIAIVNMAMDIKFTDKTIADMRLSFGGMAPVTMLARKTASALIGQQWNEAMLNKAYESLLDELQLHPSAPGGMVRYRQSLTLSLFFKSYVEILVELSRNDSSISVDKRDQSAVGGFTHRPLKSSQYFNIPSDEQAPVDPVGRPIVHKSAYKQATGEAVYCDDMPPIEGELYLALVFSTKSHARIISIDSSEAESMDGVVAFFSAKDIDEKRNKTGPIIHDEEVFISKVVTSQGQALGAVVAVDQATAQKAAKLVKVTYEEIQPVIVTIDDAIEANSFFPNYPINLERGDVDAAFKEADHIVENVVNMSGQEHFYLETHAARVVPKKEDNELEVFISGQHPTETSMLISEVLGVPVNRIIGKVKRMGGGFGGKESRGLIITLPLALAAHRLQKPVRCMLDRDEDMISTGNRHPFRFQYKVGVNNDGKILALELKLYTNAGYSYDLSTAVLERAMLHCVNAYYIPNLRLIGNICKTNLPSNTAFRGFGGPQGMFAAENIIRDIALKLNKDPLEIGYINLMQEGKITHYNQKVEHLTLKRCWDECLDKSSYYERRQQIDAFNKDNRWKKRGIAVVPTMFGIAFSIRFLNQAGALIHVYRDGSVLLSHGGTEMGQGLHTKMIQIASRALQIDSDMIHISETSTDKVPNTSATAASVSSDINGMAVLNACNTIMERLKPIVEKNPGGKWEDWITSAYLNCISLSAVGFHMTPNIGYDLRTNTGIPYNYFTNGVSCSEVEIDCLTGDHSVIRTDIVMDIGESLNPAIDIGQIEGAFIQGYGLFTMEELTFSPTGTLYSRGPGAYKIPGFTDIPQEFNVSLLKGAPNPRAIYSSKAVGEPPLFLASSVFFGIKDAITACRTENGASKDFQLDSPATVERIRMACQDPIIGKIKEIPTNVKAWNVAV